jgi:uncharacterized membrane protein
MKKAKRPAVIATLSPRDTSVWVVVRRSPGQTLAIACGGQVFPSRNGAEDAAKLAAQEAPGHTFLVCMAISHAIAKVAPADLVTL